MTNPIEKMITAAVKCTICGTQGMGNCDCWKRCTKCGWSYEKNKKCRNCSKEKGPIETTHFSGEW